MRIPNFYIRVERPHSHKMTAIGIYQIPGPRQQVSSGAVQIRKFQPHSHSKKVHPMRLLKKDPRVPAYTTLLRKVKLARRRYGGVWGSLKGPIFRIKSPPFCAAARVAACPATPCYYLLPFFPAGRQRGPLSTSGVDRSWKRVPYQASRNTHENGPWRSSKGYIFTLLGPLALCPAPHADAALKRVP